MDIVRVVDYLKKILKTRQDQVNQVITSDVKTLEEYKYLLGLSLIHISEPTRQAEISYAVFCLKKKNNKN